jgi:ribonuclease HI
MKLNVDGSFVRRGVAGIGMILRNNVGEVIIAACRQQEECQDALESELMAIEDGVRLSLVWSQSSFSVESDSAEAVELIMSKGPNTSAYAFRINSIRDLLGERNSSIAKIGREENKASHELAQIGRVQGRTEVWLGSFPNELSATVAEDCISQKKLRHVF